jgi:hypothetical protein
MRSLCPLSRVRELENRVRELERLLGRKTMETEILREALEAARPKNKPCACHRRLRTLPGEGRGWDTQHGLVQSGRASPVRISGKAAANHATFSPHKIHSFPMT